MLIESIAVTFDKMEVPIDSAALPFDAKELLSVSIAVVPTQRNYRSKASR
jgi:hypothetical protein